MPIAQCFQFPLAQPLGLGITSQVANSPRRSSSVSICLYRASSSVRIRSSSFSSIWVSITSVGAIASPFGIRFPAALSPARDFCEFWLFRT
ncbi:hypothetical protein F7734_21360 [Scytonema sp. UIC 10036]|uniref:hypothetical protein n=1 Tax=Scytonema sp. UIC 10036 TaxID=2304196 RepID=UPI0012DA7C10|nr:hypothetical protein [Scytonema sp. UIC 10036]MUG94776.1 hypothetical protein [Scytonema sp. UIC 10036]